MLKKIAGCLFFLVPVPIFAQVTAPPSVDLAYHFKPGTTLHYNRLEEIRNPDNPPGYVEGNYDIKENVTISVEKVGPDGATTLLVNNSESVDFKGGGDASEVTMGTLGMDIPTYRVTIDKFGNYRTGTVLRRTPDDSVRHEKLKDQNINVHAIDSANIKFNLEAFINKRPTVTNSTVGSKWTDTLYELKHQTHYYFNHSPTPAQEQPPEKPSYNSVHYDYEVAQDAQDRNKNEFLLATKSMNYQVGMGMLLSQFTIDDNEHIRSSDGIPTLRTQYSKRVGGMHVDNSYIKQTLTLLSIDSTK